MIGNLEIIKSSQEHICAGYLGILSMRFQDLSLFELILLDPLYDGDSHSEDLLQTGVSEELLQEGQAVCVRQSPNDIQLVCADFLPQGIEFSEASVEVPNLTYWHFCFVEELFNSFKFPL